VSKIKSVLISTTSAQGEASRLKWRRKRVAQKDRAVDLCKSGKAGVPFLGQVNGKEGSPTNITKGSMPRPVVNDACTV
jgi:hypothetical protein